jgi:hypothetical protein
VPERSRSRRRSVLLAIAATVASGCASDVEMGVSYDPLVAFPPQATWAWDEAANSLPSDERVQALNLEPLIREVVAEAFAARGYRQVAPGEPRHYLLSYQLGVATRLRPEESISVGSLSLQLAAADSHRRVWNGFARAVMDRSLTREERARRLRRELDRMLKRFPPGSED